MNIAEEVKKALSAGAVTMKQALIISQLDKDQPDFLAILLQKERDEKTRCLWESLHRCRPPWAETFLKSFVISLNPLDGRQGI